MYTAIIGGVNSICDQSGVTQSLNMASQCLSPSLMFPALTDPLDTFFTSLVFRFIKGNESV